MSAPDPAERCYSPLPGDELRPHRALAAQCATPAMGGTFLLGDGNGTSTSRDREGGSARWESEQGSLLLPVHGESSDQLGER